MCRHFVLLTVLLSFFTIQGAENDPTAKSYFPALPARALDAISQFTNAILDDTASEGKRLAAAKGIAQMVFQGRLEGRSYGSAPTEYGFRVTSSEEEKSLMKAALLAAGGLAKHIPELQGYINAQQDGSRSHSPEHDTHARWLIDQGQGIETDLSQESRDFLSKDIQTFDQLKRTIDTKIGQIAKDRGDPASMGSLMAMKDHVGLYPANIAPFISRLLPRDQVKKILC